MGSEFAYAPGAFLLRYGSVLALFVIVLLFVRHRRADRAEEKRLRGVILSALVTIIGILLYFGGPMAILVPLLLVYAGPVIFLYLVLPAFVAAALADLGFRALGTEPESRALGAGIIAAVAITIIWMGLLFQGELLVLGSEAILEYAVLGLVPVSTALIWWSYLPLEGDGEIARAFE